MAENDNNKNNFTGKIKGKTKGKIKAKMAAWFTKTFIIFVMKVLPIFLLVCMVHTAFSWIADLVESVKNPADIYEIMGIDNISDLICVAGNADDGYYLAYKQGIDEKLDEVVKRYNKGSRQYVKKDVIKKMLEAELYTQYPNLGGKIGKEADVKIGESSNAASGGSDFSGTLYWPTDGTEITSYFGPREAPTAGASTNHGAIDIGVSTGTNVYACLDGTVTIAQYSDSAGNYIEIDHGNGYVTKYMHNSQLKVSVGDKVTAGQVIALSGSTGYSTGPHVHFQIEKDGEKVDPLTFKYNNGMGASSSSSDSSSTTSTGTTTSSANKVTSLDGFLFIGDSITDGMKSEANVVDSTCTVRAVVGVGSKYWLDHYSEISSVSDVKGINIMLGTNDYDYGISYMKQLLEKLHGTFSNVTIYVDNLLPDKDSNTSEFKSYVSQLKEFCTSNSSYIKFIDPTSGVEIGSDGTHPTINGYKTLWNNIKSAILNGGGSSSSSVAPLIIAKDTGEGQDGFQGAIRIRRVTPNKTIGALTNVGTGATQTTTVVTGGLGTKEDIPESVKKQMEGISMQHFSGVDYSDLSYLTIPYFDFNGSVQQGHMVVNKKLADEVLLIFQELYKIKYPIEKMELIDNFSGSKKLTGDALDYASIEANNTSAFNDRKVVTNDGVQNTVSKHALGQAIDINPQINPYINPDGSFSHDNAKKYVKERKSQEGWSDTEKAACITPDSEIYKIFTKYGWTWLGNSSYTGDTQHFEKADLTNVKTIENREDVAGTSSSTTNTTDSNNTKKDGDNSNTNNSNNSSASSSNTSKQSEVEEYLKSAASGTWSVYAKDLTSNSDIASVNADAKMQSASVIKLFIMATAYDEMAKGNMVPTEVSSDIKLMITQSENYATNRMIDRLGFDKINNYIRSNGYTNTELNRYMLKSNANGDNYTSSKDAAKILENIYNHKCVSYEASEQMMAYLKAQQLRSKIPDGVPSGVQTANKTGELDTVENDAAIVFKDNAPYVLVVMSSGLSDTAKARQNIVDISKIVYGDGASVGGNSATVGSVTTAINSKIYDLKYIPESDFDKLVSDNDTKALEYFTLDGEWKLITAKWSYSSDEGVTISKNSPINYRSTVDKYTTPFEYLMDYYIDVKNRDFMFDFTDLALNSKLILAVEDNVTTTKMTTSKSVSFSDGSGGTISSETVINENVQDKMELTYVDTWFVKFSKEENYENLSGSSGAALLTGKQGEYMGDYVISAYCNCSICCGEYAGGPTHSGTMPVAGITVASNTIPEGSYIMFNNHVYHVEDTGNPSVLGSRIDLYMDSHEEALNWGLQTFPVYAVTDVGTASTSKDDDNDVNTEKNDKHKLINTVANVKGTVTQTHTESSNSYAGATMTKHDASTKKDYTVTSVITETTVTDTIATSYDTGDSKIEGNEDKFIKLFNDNKEAKSDLKPKWLITTVEKGEKTARFTDLTKYLLYKLTGESFGVTEFDFSIYEPGSFSSMSRGGGYDQFIRWLHAWEGMSGSLSADGTKYIIGDDGYGNITVGYGVDIFNGGFAERFAAAGYPTSVGSEVDKEFVDNLEKEEIQKDLDLVESKCGGLNLTQYQKYALVSRIYNCGDSGAFSNRNGKDFVSAFTSYWNQDKDLEYKVPANDGMFSHPLYTNYMCLPNTAKVGNSSVYSPGLVARRKAEWLLFKTGYYDRIDEFYEDGGNIVNAAAIVHDFISSNGYHYSLGDDLPGTVNDVKNARAVCCATFVSWTLYEAGYDWMVDCTGINSCATLLPFLEAHGGTKIMNPTMDMLQPGDILFYGSGGSSHTDIYIGDGLWYNCGSNDTVQRKDPYSKAIRADVYCVIRFDS